MFTMQQILLVSSLFLIAQNASASNPISAPNCSMVSNCSATSVTTIEDSTIPPQNVNFQFPESSLNDASLRRKMEESISRLLSEFNQASTANRSLNLKSMNLKPTTQKRLNELWNNLHFSCEDMEMVENCLLDVSGYMVRNIPVTLHPTDDSYKGESYRDLVISFSPEGQVTGVRMALDDNLYGNILSNAFDETDSRRMLEILKYLEDFRSYYDEKNLEALQDIFVTLINPSKASKTYLSDLAKAFSRNKYVSVEFDQIMVRPFNQKQNWYSASFRQKWSSDKYSDSGYMLITWEFKEGEAPIIHFHAWQPEWTDGHHISPDEILTENDFCIP